MVLGAADERIWTPLLSVRLQNFGAWPLWAREQRIQVPEYKKGLPVLQAEVRIASSMMWFEASIPARW